MLNLNEIYCGNCADLLKQIDDESIDMVLTSPPYDDLKNYEGYVFEFEKIVDELYRVLKKNRVVVWVVGDATVDGSETGTSFKQALYFKEIGFNIHDTMIYEKNSSTFPAQRGSNRYTQIFEFMFVFSKDKPKCNLLCDKENRYAGSTSFDGKIPPVPDYSPRVNIWKYNTSFNDKNEHPAVFPDMLAIDHIKSWSECGDVILDPMCGSGTSVKAAYELGREYIGMDISSIYCNISRNRIKNTRPAIDQDMFVYKTTELVE